MTPIIYLELDLFAACVLLVIMNYSRWKYMSDEQKLFKLAMISTIIVLILDGFSWITNKATFQGAEFWNKVTNYGYWLASMFPCYFGMLYSLRKISFKWYQILKKVGAIPIVFGLLMIVINPWTHWILYFTEGNVYHRGPYFLLSGSMSFIQMGIVTFVILLMFPKIPRYKRKEYLLLIFYMIFPILGSLIQILVYGVITIWPFLVLAMLICHVNIQYGDITTDVLTGLKNRKQYETYIRYCWDNLTTENDNMYLILLDINKFKEINDTYGHKEGDHALILSADVLSELADEFQLFVSRIGGDEFAIVMHDVEEEQVEDVVNSLRKRITKRCEGLSYVISFAVGYAMSNGEHRIELDKLFSKADQNMYADKHGGKYKG